VGVAPYQHAWHEVGSEKAFGAGYNVLSIWKKRLDAKTLVTARCDLRDELC
jgi:hypothetical protein